MKLGTLAGGIDYATVSNHLRQFERLLIEDASLHRVVKRIERNLERGKI